MRMKLETDSTKDSWEKVCVYIYIYLQICIYIYIHMYIYQLKQISTFLCKCSKQLYSTKLVMKKSSALPD